MAILTTSQLIAKALSPDPNDSFPDWCDAHIILPQGRHSEAGPWRTSRTPFLREIMENLSPHSPVEEVAIIKGAQLGLTQTAVHWCGYIMQRVPAPILFVEPTVDVAKKVSKQRVQPMLDSTPSLKGLVAPARSRDSGNTHLSKEFIGGELVMTGANSAVGLRFMSARYLVLDEEDGYPQDVDGEGPPSELAKNRLSTFARSKTLRMSTPLDETTSVIGPVYRNGSRGTYHVPCPFCHAYQWLQWKGITFTFNGEKKFSKTVYVCEHCQKPIAEHYKTRMLKEGKWVHEDPTNPVRTYHISSLYAPYGWTKVSWAALAQEFAHAAHRAKNGDTRYLKKFNNTKLAELWHDRGEQVAYKGLQARAEAYPSPCPEGVLVLTAAVDVQDSWLEALVMGWGVDEESWCVARKRVDGSPSDPTLWEAMEGWLKESRTHASGVALRVEAIAVDTRGHHTKEAGEFVKKYRGGRIFAIQGSTTDGAPLVPPRPTHTKKAKTFVYNVGTVAAKDTLFERFKIAEFGPGYIHYPVQELFDEEFFAQLSSEEKKIKYKHGVLQGRFYEKVRARNEALDLMVYNMAAFALLNPNLSALATQADKVKGVAPVPAPPAEPAPQVVPRPSLHPTALTKPVQPVQKFGKGFVKGWR